MMGEGSRDAGGGGGEVNLGFENEESKRKISTTSAPNLTSNEERLRKVSTASSQEKPKSILLNGDNYSYNSQGQYLFLLICVLAKLG